jgi:hypothetical protein
VEVLRDPLALPLLRGNELPQQPPAFAIGVAQRGDRPLEVAFGAALARQVDQVHEHQVRWRERVRHPQVDDHVRVGDRVGHLADERRPLAERPAQVGQDIRLGLAVDLARPASEVREGAAAASRLGGGVVGDEHEVATPAPPHVRGNRGRPEQGAGTSSRLAERARAQTVHERSRQRDGAVHRPPPLGARPRSIPNDP